MATARQRQLLDHGSDQPQSSRGRMPQELERASDRLASDALAKQPWRIEDTTFVLDSELSSDTEVCNQEVEAIARLLGNDLVRFLAEG